MRYEPVTGIQPSILVWARKTVGLSISDVAHSLKRPIDEIESWESGASAPTYPQLEKLASQYKRPIAVFFLPSPPEEVAPQHEFRTLPDSDLKSLTKDTHLRIRNAHAYQIALKEIYENQNPSRYHLWESISLSLTASIQHQALSIRDHLNVDIDEQIKWKNEDEALKNWRKLIESKGIFVFKDGFKQKDISGFCLINDQFPIIYLNNSTTKTRQIFSLLHELSHLLLSKNGISKFEKSYIDRLPKPEKKIEQFCNAISAEVLIPSHDFSSQTTNFPVNVELVAEEKFSDLARRYGVSREVILRRFLEQGRVSSQYYKSKSAKWTSQQKRTPGGDWYNTKVTYLSDRFARDVVSRHYRHQISLEYASDLLGIKPKNYAGIEERILNGAGA